MHNIPSICITLGISQLDLAHLIGCDRSVITRAAKGQRSLPLAASVRLAALVQQASRLQASTPPAAELTAAELQQWQTHIAELEYQRTTLHHELKTARNKQAAAGLLQRFISQPAAFQPALPPAGPLLLIKASRRLRQHSPAVLKLMETRLQAISYELELAKAALEDLVQQPGSVNLEPLFGVKKKRRAVSEKVK